MWRSPAASASADVWTEYDAEVQRIRMRDGRPEHERGTHTVRALERDRRLALLEDRELALRHTLAGGERALADRDPRRSHDQRAAS